MQKRPSVKLIPFTDEELKAIQVTLTGKILRLNQELGDGRVISEQSSQELDMLCRCAEKCAKHSMHEG